MSLPEPRGDGETYLFTKQAAEWAGVAPCTITKWRDKGWLAPVPGSPKRKPVYRLSDVRRVEAETRMRSEVQMMRRDRSSAA